MSIIKYLCTKLSNRIKDTSDTANRHVFYLSSNSWQKLSRVIFTNINVKENKSISIIKNGSVDKFFTRDRKIKFELKMKVVHLE